MTSSTQTLPVEIADWSKEALELTAGARLLLLGDDSRGKGRELFRTLNRRMTGRGLKVLNIDGAGAIPAVELLSGSFVRPELAQAHDALFVEKQREQLLDTLRRQLHSLDGNGADPVILFVSDIEHTDDGTRLLVEMLLDTAVEDFPFGESPGLRAVVVAMDVRGPMADKLARHPGTFRYDPGQGRTATVLERRKLPVEIIRAVRYMQLAALPLRLTEMEHLAGAGITERLSSSGIGIERSGRGPGATLALLDVSPAGLPDPGTLPQAELRRYHERLLPIFDARPDEPAIFVARLRHALGLQDPASVIRHSSCAVDALMAARRHAETREMLVDSIEILTGNRDHRTEAMRLRRLLARLEAAAGRPLDAAACIKSIPRARRSSEDELLLARSLLNAGRPQEAQEAIIESLGSGCASRTLTDRLRAVLAEVEYVRGNMEEAIGLCRELASSTPLSMDDRLRLANTHGKVYLARGSYAEAERIFRMNIEKAQAEGLKRHAVVARINAGIARMRLLHHASAEKLFIEARDEAAREGFYREEAIAHENLATVHHMLRDYAEAMEHYRKAFTLLRYLDNPEYLSRIANNLGEIYLRFGDVERAMATRRYARHQGADYPVSQVEAEGLLLDGRIHLMLGDRGLAEASFDQASKLFASLRDRHHMAEALIWQASCCLELNHTERARELLSKSAPLASDDVRMGARLNLVSGCLARATGKEAEPILVTALESLHASGDLEGELEALYALSEMELDRGDTIFAKQHLDRANELNTVIRSRVPERFRASFDASPIRRKLGTLQMRARAIERDRGAQPGHQAKGAVDPITMSPHPRLVGVSEPMQVVYRAIRRVAPLDDLVLIEGESGTGKELVAEAIHALSARSDRPLIKINCASFVENLLQSELFGHERGAFTGAVRRRRGWFESASGGTLFLDEIGDISPTTQVSLLRVLQDRMIYRVGGREPVNVDVRIIAATNRDLRQAVAQGRFRKDLFYRLQGMRVTLPPLRERLSDLPLLVDHMLRAICSEFRLPSEKVRFSQGAMRWLGEVGWPGNVRELENTIRSAVLFADGGLVTQRELEPYVEGGNKSPSSKVIDREPASNPDEPVEPGSVDMSQVLLGAVSLPQFKKEIERRCIEAALDESDGNITRAAGLLGMKRPRLSQLVKFYGICKDAMPAEE